MLSTIFVKIFVKSPHKENINQPFRSFLKNDREIANVVTHGLGLIFTIIGMPYLLYLAIEKSNSLLVTGVSIFAVSMFMVYLSSTLYHLFQEPKLKHRFRKFDHISIYFLIAGTYTPFILNYLQNASGSMILWIVWIAAGVGTIFKLVAVGRYNALATLGYVAMGWTAILFINQVIESFPAICLMWILVGAAFYSTGVVFYLWKKYKYHHAIWHLFVMAGSACHYIAVFNSVNLS